MSHWNFRVCRETLNGYTYYSIHEVHYNDDGVIYAYTEQPASIHGFEDIAEMRSELKYLEEALDRPVIDLPIKEFGPTPWDIPDEAIREFKTKSGLDNLKSESELFEGTKDFDDRE